MSVCNGSGIIRDLGPGDTGEVYDCPGCDACSWYAFHDIDEMDDDAPAQPTEDSNG